MAIAFTALAAAVAAFGLVLAWSYAWRVSRLVRVDASPRARRLPSLAISERAELVGELAPEGSWERALCDELQALDDDRLRLVAVNDTLAWLEHELTARARRPGVAVLVIVVGWMLVTIGGLLSGASVQQLVYCPLPALVGVAGSLWAARAGRRRAAHVRRQVDALIDALAGELDEGDLELPSRRRRRGQRWAVRRRTPSSRGPGTPFGRMD